MKKLAAFRLAPEVLTLLQKMAEKTGLSKAGLVEIAIKQLAKSELIKELKK